MAAEEAGNAIYHYELLPEGEGEVGTVSVRFRDMATGRMVEKTWTIPYEASAAPLINAAPPMRLAGSAVLLGEALDGSAIGERVRLGELNQIVSGLEHIYPRSERVKQLVQMTAQAREIE